jgi:hypothetical protein
MELRRLKNLVESGRYRLEPALVAQAMLRRRSVRELLSSGGSPLTPDDRTRPAQEAGRRAA